LGGVPPLLSLPGVTPVNPTSLFPAVSPGSGSGASSPNRARDGSRSKHIDAVTTASTVPLGGLTIGGQLAGLAVLLGAIVLAYVRFSLRGSRPSDSPGSPE
jgi:hypothetical protein